MCREATRYNSRPLGLLRPDITRSRTPSASCWCYSRRSGAWYPVVVVVVVVVGGAVAGPPEAGPPAAVSSVSSAGSGTISSPVSR